MWPAVTRTDYNNLKISEIMDVTIRWVTLHDLTLLDRLEMDEPMIDTIYNCATGKVLGDVTKTTDTDYYVGRKKYLLTTHALITKLKPAKASAPTEKTLYKWMVTGDIPNKEKRLMAKKPTTTKKNTATAKKSVTKKTPAAKNGTMICLKQICQTLKMEPKDARVKLRKSKEDKPDSGRWEWDTKGAAKIEKLLSA